MTATPAPAPAPRDEDAATPYVWLASVVIHGLLLFLVATSSGSWFGAPGRDDGGAADSKGDDDFRDVGVVVKPAEKQKSDAEQKDEQQQVNEPVVDAANARAAADGPVVPDAPPVELELPRSNDRALGPGGHISPPSRAPGDLADIVRPGGTFDGTPVAGLRAGETRFFGIQDEGLRIVYLIDKSGSMGGAKLATAKSQLLASLESLTDGQQFQVVFYNQTQFPMQLTLPRSDARQASLFRAEGVYMARSINKTLTRQYLGSVSADEGTDRESALMFGLAYQPDILYFLTDGDGVELDAKKRQRIAERNDGRTKIHCIEFGEGAPPGVRTPLKRLATENGGRHQYIRTGELGQ